MAENKNKIIVYRDWRAVFDELTDEEAGILIKHFFAYVNDEEPVLEDRILRASFVLIKNQLKRDLKLWEKKVEKCSVAGTISANKRKQSSTSVNKRQQSSTDSTVKLSKDIDI